MALTRIPLDEAAPTDAPASLAPGDRTIELIISWLLRIGVWSSIVIIVAGLILLVVKDHQTLFHHYPGGVKGLLGKHGIPNQPDPFTSYGDVVHSLVRGQSYGVITFGLMVLLLTPVLRVAVSIVGFAIERDRLYVAITAVVLLLLMLGIVLGKSGG